MNIDKLFASQLRKPNGLLGYLFADLYLNWENRSIIHHTVELLKVQPQEHLLDIGFGGGLSIRLMATAVQTGRVTGIDLSEPMVAKARKKFARKISQGRVRVVQGSVSKLPFVDGEFDKISAIHTLYFWPELERALQEVYRVLKPGGLFAVALHSKQKMEAFPLTKHGFSLFTEKEVANLLESSGFSNVSIQSFDTEKALDFHYVIGYKPATL